MAEPIASVQSLTPSPTAPWSVIAKVRSGNLGGQTLARIRPARRHARSSAEAAATAVPPPPLAAVAATAPPTASPVILKKSRREYLCAMPLSGTYAGKDFPKLRRAGLASQQLAARRARQDGRDLPSIWV